MLQQLKDQVRTQVPECHPCHSQPPFANLELVLFAVYASHSLSCEFLGVHSISDVIVSQSKFLPFACTKGVLREICSNVTRHNVADLDVVGFELSAETVEDPDEGVLGATVGGAVGSGDFSGNAGDPYDLATFVLDHVLDATLDMMERPMHVHFKQVLMILEGIVTELTPHRHSRVFHQYVQFLATTLQLFDHGLTLEPNFLVVRHVQWNHLDLFGIFALRLHSFQLRAVTCRYYDGGSSRVELVSKVLSNTGRGSSNPDCALEIVGSAQLAVEDAEQGVKYE